MPTGLQRQRDKARKAVLTPEQVARRHRRGARRPRQGRLRRLPVPRRHAPVRAARPAVGRRRLRRERSSASAASSCKDGTLSEVTKTAAGARSIPMSPLLREMLLAWRVRCPRKDGKLHRVFPAPGNARAWPLPRENGGGPLIYNNFRTRFWAPTLKRLGLPPVTPHSARHQLHLDACRRRASRSASSPSSPATRTRS